MAPFGRGASQNESRDRYECDRLGDPESSRITGRIVTALSSGAITALHDDRILSEYREVLLRPRFGFSRSDVEVLLDFVEWVGEHVSAEPLSLILPDPNDLPFLEVATTGGAGALITGNIKHFKPRRGEHSVLVATPADFLRRHEK